MERFHGVSFDGLVEQLRGVVIRGIRRGEVRPGADGKDVFAAVPAMMMYRSKMCASE